MEESILLTIKYVLRKKNIINEDNSIDSFFSNGVSFPLFIAKIFDFPSFPGIIEKPESEMECQLNNNKALQFLLENNSKIKSLNPKIETKEDKNDLLKLILIHLCFPASPIKIKNKLNLTFESSQFQIKTINDMLNLKTMSLILHIFTKESFPITDSLEEISQNCKKSNIPLVVNESSLEYQNRYIFLIQIQIFYDFFSSCSQEMIKSIQSKLKQKNEDFQSESEEDKSQSYDDSKTDSQSNSDEEYHYAPLVENLKNLDTKLTEEKFKLKEKLLEIKKSINDDNSLDSWYFSLFQYSYMNGFLVKIPRCSFYKYDVSQFVKKTNGKKLTQLFKYNNSKKQWVFCSKAFKQLFYMNDKDQMMKLILFMISEFQDTLFILQYYKKDLLEYEFDDEIAIYAFVQEELKKDSDCFLFLHVPKTKIDHKNIQSIMYQIFTFLYLICDVTFIELGIEETLMCQIDFVQNVIKISNMYLKNVKKSNGQNMFIDHSLLAYIKLTKDKDISLINEAKLIKEKITNKYKIIIVSDGKDLVEALFNHHYDSYRYSELYDCFIYINSKFLEISELYLNLGINEREQMNDILQITIKKEYDKKYALAKYANDKQSIMLSIEKESKLYFPQYDIAFANIFEMELINFSFKNDLFNKTIYIKKLKKASESNLAYLDKTLNKKSYYDENQIITFKEGHHNFLKKKFFDIIKETYDGSVSLVYENLIDILESQILEDNEKLFKIFNKYKEKNEIKNLKFADASKKGTNYVIKEVETTREIEICIDSEEDLEKIMPQDF